MSQTRFNIYCFMPILYLKTSIKRWFPKHPVPKESTKQPDKNTYCRNFWHWPFFIWAFLSTFPQPVNNSKNSILNWVMKLNLFKLNLQVNFSSKLSIKLYTDAASDKQCTSYASTVRKVLETHFSANWRPKFRDSELSKQ